MRKRWTTLAFLLTTLLLLSIGPLKSQCPGIIGDTVFVTSSGNVAGSLRNAIICANDPANSVKFIHFNITNPGIITITPTPAAPLPAITKSGVIIDARTQPGWFLGKIEIDGTLDASLNGNANGLTINASNCEVYGLFIRDFNHATNGVGIDLLSFSGNLIEENAISGNRIGIRSGSNSTSFIARNNIIGLDPNDNSAMGNSAEGIRIEASAGGTYEASNSNVIAHNSKGIFTLSPAVDFLISQNSFFCNTVAAIDRGGFTVSPFSISSATTSTISGQAPGGALVEVFVHDATGCPPGGPSPCQGRTFVGSATAGALNTWTLSLNPGIVFANEQVTATATVGADNTSEFLDCVTAIADCTALAVNFEFSDETCGNADGIATAFPSGGAPTYSYNWSNDQTGDTATGLTAGTYTVTVTDANNCTISGSVTIGNIEGPTAAPSSNSPVCAGNDLLLFAGGSGGSAPLSFSWEGPNNFSSNDENPVIQGVTSLAAGNYTVTVSDDIGCSVRQEIAVVINQLPIASLDVTDVDCNGAQTGAIDLNPSGGSPPYVFSWNNNETSEDLSDIPAETYSVTVTDSAECTATASAMVDEPTKLTVSVEGGQETCSNANASAVALPSGGQSPYTFNWSNGGMEAEVGNLSEGAYTVTVTDANDCTETAQIGIENIPGPTTSIVPTDVDCNGASTGAADLMINGGTFPFSFDWSNSADTEDLLNVPAGIYSVTVSDGNACTSSSTVNIDEPSEISINFIPTDATCGTPNGSATADASGGTGPYSYSWNNNQNGPTATGLAAGNYTVFVSDQNNCQTSAQVTINNIDGPTTSIFPIDTECNGEASGNVILQVMGGTGPFSFIWSNEAISQNLINVPAGTYFVTITDGMNCLATNFATVSDPPALQAGIAPDHASCGLANGSAIASPLGGTPPYSFVWSNGQVGPLAINLAPGLYGLTTTDGNSCTHSALVTINNIEGAELNAEISDATCQGGNSGGIDLFVEGGTAPYSFLWSNEEETEDLNSIPAGVYSVTVTDANDCTSTYSATVAEPNGIQVDFNTEDALCGASNGMAEAQASGGAEPYSYAWDNDQMGPIANNLAASIYTVTVTDANDCSTTEQISINNVGGPFTDITVENVNCNGSPSGRIILRVDSGTPPYNFQWNNDSTTQNLNNIPAGSYMVTVTDESGCITTDMGTVIEPDILALELTSINTTCGMANGTATALATGGEGPHSYAWSDDQIGPDAINLSAATYSVTTTDDNGCTLSSEISVNNTPGPLLDIQGNEINCNGATTGMADLSLEGGTMPFNFLWSNGAMTQDLEDLTAGTYGVSVTDANDCIATAEIIISEPNPIEVDVLEEFSPSVQGGTDGALIFELSGGMAPYSFTWAGPQNGMDTANEAGQDTIFNLSAGEYEISVTDGNDCEIIDDFFIIDGGCDLMLDSLQVQDISCPGFSDGYILAFLSGITPPVNYNWTSGNFNGNGTGTMIPDLIPGTYFLTFTDQSSCALTGMAVVEDVELPQPQPGSLSECDDGTGAATFNLSLLNEIINPGGFADINWYFDEIGETPILNPTNLTSQSTRVFASLVIGDCETQTVEVVLEVIPQEDVNCQGCTSYAGTVTRMMYEPIRICPGDQGVLMHDGDEILDDNDALEFVVHDQSGPDLGNILARNSSPVFAFNSLTMEAEVIYFVSAIAGNDIDGNGEVDISDPCLSVSEGRPIVFGTDYSGVLNFLQAQDSLCQGDFLLLSTNNLMDSMVTYHWILPSGDTSQTTESQLGIPNIGPEDAGEYFVFMEKEACFFDQTGPVILEVFGLAEGEVIDAGSDTSVCTNSVILNASPVSSGSAFWKPLSGGQIADPLNPAATASNLEPGENLFVWSVSTGACDGVGADTVRVIYEAPISATDDFFILQRSSTVIFMDILKNDNVPEGVELQLNALGEPQFGSLETLEDAFRFFEDEGQRGTVTFDYEICYPDAVCPEPCAVATVTIDVLNLPYLSEGITPNNDGINDKLNVQGLFGDPKLSMKVTITNRWGDIVFKSNDYINDPPWDGRSQSSGKELPQGAYYCLIETTIDDETYSETQVVYIVK